MKLPKVQFVVYASLEDETGKHDALAYWAVNIPGRCNYCSNVIIIFKKCSVRSDFSWSLGTIQPEAIHNSWLYFNQAINRYFIETGPDE